jgi:hypothetical protein
VFQHLRAPPGLFDHFPQRRVRRFLAGVDDAARQLPAELLGHEAVPPHHEHAVLIVQHGGHRNVVQLHHVMLERLHSGRLHIPELKLHPPVVVQVALTVDSPRLHSFGPPDTHRAGHPVRTATPYLQCAFSNETCEHLPQCRPADAEFFD